MRRRLPLVIVFAVGLFAFLQYFTPLPLPARLYAGLLDWMQIIFAFSLLVGVAALLSVHLRRVARRGPFWPYSLLTLGGIVAMAVSGFVWGTEWGSPFLWMFTNLQVPMQSTMFALLAFFVASAAYRGFRFRNFEAGLLMATALVVMLAKLPLGSLISPEIPRVADWIIDVPSVAAKRAILIGVGLGSVTTALRVILGIERSSLGT